jgi:hypothetical protein
MRGMLFGGVIIAGFLGLWPIALVMSDFHPLRYWEEHRPSR